MKIISILIAIVLMSNIVYANRVCLRKSDGKLIEYQSGNAFLGTLTRNAVEAGYNASDIEEVNVTEEEWAQIRYEQLEKPAEDEQKEKDKKIKSGKKKLKDLGLTQDEIDSLF